MDKLKLKEVLELHLLWLKGDVKGGKANLERANLERANLRGANLRGANLEGANLRGANLERANLGGANLGGACLEGANLRGAYLEGASLEGANLRGAYLGGANLERANLRGAYLGGANLERANLRGAYLEEVNLRGANLEEVNLAHHKILPEFGDFTAFKKLANGDVIEVIVKGRRLNAIGSRKGRTDRLLVGKTVITGSGRISGRTGNIHPGIHYIEGEEIKEPNYCDDVRIECAPGLHFFLTKQEAIEW